MATRSRSYDYHIECNQCGTWFDAATPAAKYCSDKCRLAASRDRRKVSELLKTIEYEVTMKLVPAAKKYPVFSESDFKRLRWIIGSLELLSDNHDSRRQL